MRLDLSMKTTAPPTITCFELEVESFSLSLDSLLCIYTILTPIFSDFFYRAHEILKRGICIERTSQTRQPGRQAGTVVSICVAIRAGRTLRACIVYTLWPSERVESGSQPPGGCGMVCLREQRETRLPLNRCSRGSVDDDGDGGSGNSLFLYFPREKWREEATREQKPKRSQRRVDLG